MTDQQILEGNKLIAQFMGVKVLYDGKPVNGLIHIQIGKAEYQAIYHRSWDWLMPVYLKIVKQELYAADETGIALFNVMYDRLGDGDGIDEVYKSVLEFIKWYKKAK